MTPVSDCDVDRLFSRLFRRQDGSVPRLTLAVSGGADSMALMVLAARWRAAAGAPDDMMDVATVDHGLRPESAAEAALVSDAARSLNFSATILRWEAPERKRLQERARDARYALLAAHVRATGRVAAVTAHTEDDQAETLLMRLARGSGVDGLAAMQAVSTIGGVPVLRPFLGVSKARLVATLQAAGVPWIDDPSNESAAFERVRIRAERAPLDRLGLSARALAASAGRLGRARRALDWMTTAALADPATVHVSDLGFAGIPLDRYLELPEDIRLRIVLRLIEAVGGSPAPIPMAAAETLVEEAAGAAFRGRSLARCLVARRRGVLMIVREPGRHVPAARALAPGETLTFDNRFEVTLAERAPPGFHVAPAGEAGARRARELGLVDEAVPAAALRTLPGLHADGRLQLLPLRGDPLAETVGCLAEFSGPQRREPAV